MGRCNDGSRYKFGPVCSDCDESMGFDCKKHLLTLQLLSTLPTKWTASCSHFLHMHRNPGKALKRLARAKQSNSSVFTGSRESSKPNLQCPGLIWLLPYVVVLCSPPSVATFKDSTR